MNDHQVMFDRAGWGNYPRLTCLTCNVTCLKAKWMNTPEWIKAVEVFNEAHPSKTGKETLEAFKRVEKVI